MHLNNVWPMKRRDAIGDKSEQLAALSAQYLGMTIPLPLLGRADEVIE